ncbi:unnamed protein product [Callosobruchus maculatus]|uniref:Uncharacterized protein n=1 Tax=Callosobruchus maculatus TaxID=64391 RepID=A0A653DS10_CALMS|nr:unnamed protein product [Callosobruchus maculatus]
MSKHSELFYKKLDDYYSDRNKKNPWNIAELTEVAAVILRAKQNSDKKREDSITFYPYKICWKWQKKELLS